MHLEDCPHKMNAVCPPVFRTQHPDLRRRRIDNCRHTQQLCKNVAGNFRQEFSEKFVVGILLKLWKKKVSNYIAGIVPIGPGRRYTLSIYSTTTLLYNHPNTLSAKKPQHKISENIAIFHNHPNTKSAKKRDIFVGALCCRKQNNNAFFPYSCHQTRR